MCWNCGCGMPENDMGSKDVITTEKLRKAAKAGGNKSIKELMANMITTYDTKVKGTPADTAQVK